MRALIASSLCLFAILPVAQAATLQTGFVAVQASNSQGAAFTSGSRTTGDGNSTGLSASFSANDQTFGQSNGTSATTTTKSTFANNRSKMVAGVGFLDFENAC